ncbi:MAG: DUF6355 family natural product biosynthesis protein [Pseudonocardiaceae bacterium]
MGALVPAGAVAAADTGNTSTRAAAPAPCGFYEDGGAAWYNHCAPGRVVIHIDGDRPRNECAPDVPGRSHYLGTADSVDNAYYAGRRC